MTEPTTPASTVPVTTTDAGIAAPSDEYSLSVGGDGPLLLQDHDVIQKMAQFNRERVPERVVHAKGTGGYGFFEATEDVSQYTKADFLKKGIGPSPDRMLQGRLFSYPDTHRYRIGPNYLQLPVNQPKVRIHSYNKDGARYHPAPTGQPVYAPNSYGGPAARPDQFGEPSYQVGGELLRSAYRAHREDDDFSQAATLYRQVLSETDGEHLVTNIVGHASQGLEPQMTARVIEYWRSVDPDLGARVAKGLSDGR